MTVLLDPRFRLFFFFVEEFLFELVLSAPELDDPVVPGVGKNEDDFESFKMTSELVITVSALLRSMEVRSKGLATKIDANLFK